MPAGDLALREAAGLVKRKRKRPEEAALRRMGEAWRPWRSVASRLLWHYYAEKILSRKPEEEYIPMQRPFELSGPVQKPLAGGKPNSSSCCCMAMARTATI